MLRTSNCTLAETEAVPTLEHVKVKIWEPAVNPVLSSDAPVADFVPDHPFDAVHSSGLPVVVQVRRVVFAGRIIGHCGVADRLTVILLTGLTVMRIGFESTFASGLRVFLQLI